MQTVSNEIVEQQLRWRYATKLFDSSRKISDADWRTLEQSLVLSPSSFGLQPWKFFVVTDASVRARLLPATFNQTQVVDASHLVVLAIRKTLQHSDIERHVARTAEVRGVTVESLVRFQQMMAGALLNGSKDLDTWATHQVYIALGMFMATAALMGIDVTPMEGFDPSRYDEILGLSALGYGSAVIAAAGYRSSEDKYASLPKVRFKTEDVVARI